jgi:hypothetical protein
MGSSPTLTLDNNFARLLECLIGILEGSFFIKLLCLYVEYLYNLIDAFGGYMSFWIEVCLMVMISDIFRLFVSIDEISNSLPIVTIPKYQICYLSMPEMSLNSSIALQSSWKRTMSRQLTTLYSDGKGSSFAKHAGQ